MLTLITGQALAPVRHSLLALPLPGDRLFVVPDELTAAALAREIYGDESVAVDDSTVIAFESFVERLTEVATGARLSETTATERWVPEGVALAAVRLIIESDPNSFDYLVGQNSVPRLSHGVLERIVASMDSLRKGQESEDGAQLLTRRGRQLQELAGRFEEKLTVANARLEKHGQKEALAALTKAQWKQVFPGIKHVVFLDFLDHSDMVYLAMNVARRHAGRFDVLLEFDPEDDSQGQSAMEDAYMRINDLADDYLQDAQPSEGQVDLFEAGEQDAAAERILPKVILTGTVAQEVSAVAGAVQRVISGGGPANQSVVVALTNWDGYAPLLEKAFSEHGIYAVWQQVQSPLRSGEWLLLDRLRQCSFPTVTGSSVSALFRAPGFPALLPETVSGVDAWDLASRLDYVLTLTGKLQGWAAIERQTGRMLEQLQRSRRNQKLWTEEEGAHDERLRQLLSATRELCGELSQQRLIPEWSRKIVGLLSSVAQTGELSLQPQYLRREVIGLMKTAAAEVGRLQEMFSTDVIPFGTYLSIFRTVLYRQKADNLSAMQSQPVTVCSAAVAASLRADVCMVLGCNDGNFPRFAKPEANFLGQRFQPSQSGLLNRQRLTLNRILRNHRQTLLWMPERIETEDALPSQFVEELLERNEAVRQPLAEFAEEMRLPTGGAVGRQQGEFVENLRGMELSQAELDRFALRSPRAYQVAHSLSLLAQRSKAEMGGYDGVITDPVLKKWVRKWADGHIYSVSQLDTLVACSFRFFVERILHLEEPEEADALLPAHAFGSFAHDVLAVFYRKWVAEGRGVPRLDDEKLARHEIFQAYLAEYEHTADLSEFARDLLNLKLFGDLGPEGFRDGHRELEEARDTGVFGQFLLMEMRRGENPVMDFLKPAAFEVGFGMGVLPEDDPLSVPQHLELDLGDGEHIKVRGRIDRIDLSSTGVFAVTDYKTGKVPTQRSIVDSYRTQLPVYVMIGEQLLRGKYERPEPAGGLYYSLRKGENAKVSGAFFRDAYKQQAGVSGRCLQDDAFEQALENVKVIMSGSVKSVRAGRLTSTWRDEDTVCTYCPFGGFCYRNVERTREYLKGVELAGDEAEA